MKQLFIRAVNKAQVVINRSSTIGKPIPNKRNFSSRIRLVKEVDNLCRVGTADELVREETKKKRREREVVVGD